MEVTRFNFKETLPLIENSIVCSDFISLDCEFTGLPVTRSLNYWDTPEDRYHKFTKESFHALLIQFGLCTFRYDPYHHRYGYKAFNFYIYPRPLNDNSQEQSFLFSPSGLEFLSRHGFDFNKLISGGISYLPIRSYMFQKEKLQERQKEDMRQLLWEEAPHNTISVPDQHKAFLQNVLNEIEKLLVTKEQDSFSLNPCNSFLRRLIYESVPLKYPGQILVSTRQNDDYESYLVVSKTSKDTIWRDVKQIQEEDLNKLEDSVGFCKVVELLTKSRKLIIGHNMLFDILFILRQFIGPLPKKYHEFKCMFKDTFPYVIDTKYVASTEPFKSLIQSTGLTQLMRSLQKPPFDIEDIHPLDGFENYTLKNERLHEAGYDAFITGVAFLAMNKYLSRNRYNKAFNLRSLEPYINKIYMRQSPDIPFIDMENDNVIPKRDHVFYVEFPKDWNNQTVKESFWKFGNVGVYRNGTASAFVALEDPEMSEFIRREVTLRPLQGLSLILPYSEYRAREHLLRRYPRTMGRNDRNMVKKQEDNHPFI